MYDLISGQPGADGKAGRCVLMEHRGGDWIEYVGWFDHRRGLWTLYLRGGDRERIVVSVREVRDCRRRPEEQAGEKKTEKPEERRRAWWRLPDPPGQIKLGE